MSEDRVFLTFEKAVEMLPEREDIHTFRSPGILVGASWSKDKLLKTLKKFEDTLELSDSLATGMGHGLYCNDGVPLFIETKKD